MAEMLAEKTCTPCRGGIPPLTREEAQRFQARYHLLRLRHRQLGHGQGTYTF